MSLDFTLNQARVWRWLVRVDPGKGKYIMLFSKLYNHFYYSTVVSLLLRFYESEFGTISVGDRDIKDYNLQHYRRNFGLVMQVYISPF